MRFSRRFVVSAAPALLLLALDGQVPAWAGPYSDYVTRLARNPPAGSTYRPDLERQLAGLATGYRVKEGKPPLTADPLFQMAARAHAADMMLHDFIGHRSSTGLDFDSRMRALAGDITRFPALAENAARDSRSAPADAGKAEALFQQWLDSPPHRKTLRSLDYRFVSTGVIQRGDTIWAVQIFWATPRAQGLFSSSGGGQSLIMVPGGGASPSQ